MAYRPSAEEELGPDDVVKVLDELLEARNQSYVFGLKLKLPLHVVDSIHADYFLPRDRLLHILIEFSKKVEPKPTWRAIVDALKSPSVNLPRLAERVEAAHFPDPTSTTGDLQVLVSEGQSEGPRQDSPEPGVITVQYVQKKIQKFQKRFNDLKKATRICLETRKIPVKQVTDVLTSVKIDEHQQFLENHSSIISHVSTHSELFGAFRFNWNYLSYKLLDHVIQEFDLEVKGEMATYKDDIQQFREKTPLTLFCLTQKERNIEPLPNFQEMVEEFKWPDDVTLEVVEQFRKEYTPCYHLRDVAVMLAVVYIDRSGKKIGTLGSGDKQETSSTVTPGDFGPINPTEPGEENFVEHPSGNVFCPVTCDLLLQPHLTACCGQHISQEAVAMIQGEERGCPMCNTPCLITILNKHFLRQVKAVQVTCHYKVEGCDWKGSVSQFKDHVLHSCSYHKMEKYLESFPEKTSILSHEPGEDLESLEWKAKDVSKQKQEGMEVVLPKAKPMETDELVYFQERIEKLQDLCASLTPENFPQVQPKPHGAVLNDDSLWDVLNALVYVKGKWILIGLGLHLPVDRLREIWMNSRNSLECLKKVLEEWLHLSKSRPTWAALIAALRSPVVAENNLADHLQEIFFPAETLPVKKSMYDKSGEQGLVVDEKGSSLSLETSEAKPELVQGAYDSSVPEVDDVDKTVTIPGTETHPPNPVFDVIAEKTVTVTNEEQTIDWQEYGLRMFIPSNALPEHCDQFQLKMEVALSGRFELPGDGVLASAIYLFSHNLGKIRLRRPVTLEMQHFAAKTAVDINQLCIVRATEGSGALCEFDVMPGGVFNQSDGYGIVNLRHFCSLAVYVRWLLASVFSTLKPCAKLYYTDIQRNSFRFYLYLVPELAALLTEIETDFKREHGRFDSVPISPFDCNETTSSVSLDIPEEHVCGWKMKLHNPHKVNPGTLHYFKKLAPFRVDVSWVGGADKTALEHEIKIAGEHVLTVVSPPLCTGNDELSVGADERVSTLDETPTLLTLEKFKKKNGDEINILDKIGDKYRAFATHLLDDGDGTITDEIVNNYRGQAADIKVETITKWLKGTGKRPVSWRTLAGVLDTIRQSSLADIIREAL